MRVRVRGHLHVHVHATLALGSVCASSSTHPVRLGRSRTPYRTCRRYYYYYYYHPSTLHRDEKSGERRAALLCTALRWTGRQKDQGSRRGTTEDVYSSEVLACFCFRVCVRVCVRVLDARLHVHTVHTDTSEVL